MKKYIALFSVVAVAVMAVALTSNAASCNISANVGDDYTALCAATSARTFRVTNTANTNFNSTTINVANSGLNVMLAGDDLEEGTVSTGAVSATTEATYDVGSTDIVYNMNDEETMGNIQGNTELEDAVLGVVSNDTLTENVTNNSDVNASETDVVVGNSGLNIAAAADDNEGTTLTAGTATTKTSKSWFVGYNRVYRNAGMPQ